MTRISLCETMAVTPEALWADIEDLASHEEWMADADRIRFRTEQRSGVGTVFDCRTRVGPIAVTDVLEVTEWEPAAVMGIVHQGAVTGTGRFTLEPVAEGTRFCWTEVLRFPWWLGGPVGARASAPIFRWIWRRNLAALRARVERPGDSPGRRG